LVSEEDLLDEQTERADLELVNSSIKFDNSDPERLIAFLNSVSAEGATQISFRRPIFPIPNYDKRDWNELLKVKLILADDAIYPVNSVEKFSVLSISS